MQCPGHVVGQPQRRIVFALLQKNYGFPPHTDHFGQSLLGQATPDSIFLNPGFHRSLTDGIIRDIAEAWTYLISDSCAEQAFEIHDQAADNSHRKAQRAYDGGHYEEYRFLEFATQKVHNQSGNGIVQENTDDQRPE